MRGATTAMAAAAMVALLTGGGSELVRAQARAWQRLPAGPPAVEAPVGLCPSDPDLIYIGTFGGGVLKSRDAGRHFDAVNDGLTNLAIAALAVDPVHCEIVYAGAFGSGIFKTVDGGRTWTATSETAPTVLWLAVDPMRPSIVYAGLQGGFVLRRSVDGGATWFNASRGIPAVGVWSIQVDRAHPDVLYAGTAGAGGFKSTDGGATWQAMPLPSIVWALAIDPRDSSVVYAGTNGDGVWRSSDGGASFTPVGVPGNGVVLVVAVDPGRSDVVYAGTAGGGVAVSRDGGRTFTAAGLDGSLALSLAVRADGQVFAGTGNRGVHMSGSYGAVWTPVAAPHLNAIHAQNVYALEVDPANPARIVAATNDGGLIGSADGGLSWGPVGTGFTSRAARRITFDPADARRLYVGSFNGGGLQVSEDGGATWTPRRFGSASVYVWSTAVNRASGEVYAGTVADGLWRSRDRAATFARVGPATLTNARAVAADGERLLVGGRLGVHRSVDGGVTWTQPLTVDIGNLTVDPRNPNLVYAAAQTAGVLRSTDGGATFAPINTGLTNLRTSRGNGVLVDPRDSTRLYLGTEGGGVFTSADGGATWRAVNDGLENLVVLGLALDPQHPEVLYAGGGSGVFRTTTGGERRP